MLTTDMLRVRQRKGVIVPSYVKVEDEALLALATGLIAAFEASRGMARGALKEKLADVVSDVTDLVLRKGLIKLLEDRCVFEVASPVDPREIRRVVFELSSQVHPVAYDGKDHDEDVLLWTDGGLSQPEMTPDLMAEELEGQVPLPLPNANRPLEPEMVSRAAVLRQAGASLNLTGEQVLEHLYGDLPAAQVLKEFKGTTALALLERYNVALAQGVLLRATELRLTIKGNAQKRYRQLFRGIKFHRLMHRIVATGKGAYDIQLDGPVSLFKSSSRYGLQMALFLPILLKCKGWKLEATLSWGKKRETRAFKLSPRAHLVSHYPDRGQYKTQEEKWFVERFEVLDTPWTLDFSPALLTLPDQNVVIPDVALCHPDGRRVLMEILGFWRKGALLSRLQQLRGQSVDHLILAVSKNMQGSVEGLGDVPPGVIYFRDIIPPKQVIALAEEMNPALP